MKTQMVSRPSWCNHFLVKCSFCSEYIVCTGFHEGIVWNACWNPKGDILASCGQDRVIRLWKKSVEEGIWKLTDELRDAHTKTVRAVAFCPSGKYLAAGAFDGTVSIWINHEDGDGGWKCVATLEGHENEVKSVSWSPDGRLLATCGRDKTVWVWEVVSSYVSCGNYDNDSIDSHGDQHRLEDDLDFECLAVLVEHSQDVKMVQFSPVDGRCLVSSSYDDTVKVLKSDLEQDEWSCYQTIGEHASTVWATAFSPNGKTFVSVGDDRKIAAYRRETSGKKEWICIGKREFAHDRPITTVDFRNGLVITGGTDRKAKIWKLCECGNESFEKIAFQEMLSIDMPERREVNSVRWNPCHEGLVAIAGDDGHLQIVNITAQAEF